jgi:DNA-directed RNA polymerase sigma subunit (sigma70/sigma32)
MARIDDGAHGLAEGLTRPEIAEHFQITWRRVEQVERGAIRALRWPPGAKRLAARRSVRYARNSNE